MSDLLIMITGKAPMIENKDSNLEYFDYQGLLYPVGNIGQDSCYCFNEEKIEKVVYYGYFSEEMSIYNKMIRELITTEKISKVQSNKYDVANENLKDLDKVIQQSRSESSINKLFN